MNDCPSRFTIARWKIGELSSSEQVAMTLHLNQCPDCQRIVVELEEQTHRCRERRDVNLAQIKTRLERESHAIKTSFWVDLFKSRKIYPAIAVMAAACVAVVLALGYGDRVASESGSKPMAGIKYRGTMALALRIDRGGHVFEVEPDSELYAGDHVEFSVTTSSAGHICVFLMDRDGKAVPLNEPVISGADLSDIPLHGPGYHKLPGRYTLGPSVSLVGFGALFSVERIDVKEALKKIENSFSQIDREGVFDATLLQDLSPLTGSFQGVSVR